MSYPRWVGLAVVAVVGFGVWSASRPARVGTTPSVRSQLSLPKADVGSATPAEERNLGATSKPVERSLDAACGPGLRASADGTCAPIDPATGDPYSAARLQEFEAIRQSSYVARDNLLVPRPLTVAEAKRRRDIFAKANELGRKIEEGKATGEEIEDFFGFRARMRGYREQLLTFEQARTGGRVSAADPVLDREEIDNPEILARYDELERAMQEEYAQKEEALRRITLTDP
jgi:hypothetical protein